MKRFFVATLLVLLTSGVLFGQMGMDTSVTKKSGPLPAPNVEGLDEFNKLLVFAARDIEEGYYEDALENLLEAVKLEPSNPVVHEMLGIVYDAERDSEKAFSHFKKAGWIYFDSGNIDKAWQILGWMRTIKYDSPDVLEFEKKLRQRQEVINRERFEKKG